MTELERVVLETLEQVCSELFEVIPEDGYTKFGHRHWTVRAAKIRALLAEQDEPGQRVGYCNPSCEQAGSCFSPRPDYCTAPLAQDEPRSWYSANGQAKYTVVAPEQQAGGQSGILDAAAKNAAYIAELETQNGTLQAELDEAAAAEKFWRSEEANNGRKLSELLRLVGEAKDAHSNYECLANSPLPVPPDDRAKAMQAEWDTRDALFAYADSI